MKTRELFPALALITLAAMPFTKATSAELLGYVDLTWTGTFVDVNGGGVRKFTVGTIADTVGDTSDVGAVLGRLDRAQGTMGLAYAICFEYDEHLSSAPTRYALYEGLGGAMLPSSTQDIVAGEADLIDRVLTAEFGNTLIDNVVTDYAMNIRGLQALLWEAGATSSSRAGTAGNAPPDDFANKLIDRSVLSAADRSTAEAWLSDSSLTLDTVTTYALVAQNGQDFAFFLRDLNPPLENETPPLPVPGTLLLVALGLLGARASRRPR